VRNAIQDLTGQVFEIDNRVCPLGKYSSNQAKGLQILVLWLYCLEKRVGGAIEIRVSLLFGVRITGAFLRPYALNDEFA